MSPGSSTAGRRSTPLLRSFGALVGWVRRRRARLRLATDVALWYHSEYAPSGLKDSTRATGLDVARGEHILGLLARDELLRPGDVHPSPTATALELARFHTGGYLESVSDLDVLARIFGIDPLETDPDVLLNAQRRAVGGTIAAARAVAGRERSIAVNLGGGFHHAEPDRGMGFCILNDVGVAIAALRAEGFAGKIAIVDLDFHQGNGNLVAFAGDESVLSYSMHGSVFSHVEAKAAREILLSAGTADKAYLDVLAASLPEELATHRPELIFYVAGTDVLRGDRLGTFNLSLEGVLTRDIRVVELAESLGAGLVVVMGGGYSDNAWVATANLLRFVLTGDTRAPRAAPSVRSHYERIARELDPRDLQRDDRESEGALITAEDLEEMFHGHRPARRVLDFYSAQGIELAFERYGILAKIRARGYDELTFEIDARDSAHQLIRIHGRHPSRSARLLLVELVVAKVLRHLERAPEPPVDLGLISIEWLLLQDPAGVFTLERPRLPGQEHPGLGIAEEMTELLIRAAKRLNLDGLLDRPAHYHVALGTREVARFLEPRDEGRFLAMSHALARLSPFDATLAVENGGLALASGERMPWIPAEHVFPASDRLWEYFASETYRVAAEAEAARLVRLGLHLVEA